MRRQSAGGLGGQPGPLRTAELKVTALGDGGAWARISARPCCSWGWGGGFQPLARWWMEPDPHVGRQQLGRAGASEAPTSPLPSVLRVRLALPPALLRWMPADSWGYFGPVGSAEGTARGAVTPDSRKEFPLEFGKLEGPRGLGGKHRLQELPFEVFSGRVWGQHSGERKAGETGSLGGGRPSGCEPLLTLGSSGKWPSPTRTQEWPSSGKARGCRCDTGQPQAPW